MWSLPTESQTEYYYGEGGNASIQLIKVEDGGIACRYFSPPPFCFLSHFFISSEMAGVRIKRIF